MTDKVNSPLLTIAIPTWNRADYLRLALAQIQAQRAALPRGAIELLVCDNCSTDATPEVVAESNRTERPIRSIRHSENIGPDANIAACFKLASGRYVWFLGDDDLPIDGVLAWLVQLLSASDYGLIYLRPYGYEHDFRAEYPGQAGKAVEYTQLDHFLARVGAHLTFISSIIVNKSLIPEIDATAFCGSHLAQVEIYLSAALRARHFLCSGRYCVACKRNNSGGYDFAEVFVERLGHILDRYRADGLTAEAISNLDRAMLVRYFPQYVWALCVARRTDLPAARRRFRARYSHYLAYWLFVAPIFALPRPVAVVWGALATLLGRGLHGDLRHGISFALNRIRPHP